MPNSDIARAISALTSDYAAATEPEVLTSARAQLLSLIDRLSLEKAELTTERIDPGRFRTDTHLRGAIRAHLDLAFRRCASSEELLATTTRGVCRVAWHPALPAFPVGVALALPASKLASHRAELFADDSVTLAGAPLLMLLALATNPARLGAGSLLIQGLRGDCGQFTPRPRLVAFSPLIGLRARVIALLDDEDTWLKETAGVADLDRLRLQITEALGAEGAPVPMPEPFGSWLAGQAKVFAHSTDYVVGRFHRRQGASLIGIAHNADPRDAGALWARALFDYLN